MSDYYHDPRRVSVERLDVILDHILVISRGDCAITDEEIIATKDDKYQLILSGLKLLHADLQEYKEDFTRKIEAEYQLEILKQKNEELIQFNYVASHDLQEPLRTITSFGQLLEDKLKDELDNQSKVMLDFILESATRMSDLISNLLNYSKVGQTLDFERVNSRSIVDKVLMDLGQVIKETKPDITVGDLPEIHCNRIAIAQVFQNLIGNGLKFRKEGRPVKLLITCDSTEDMLTFCIADNGIGIASEYTSKIFGIFQRLHTKTEYEGTGIGLALCMKVMDMHQGKIWLKSKEGIGSKFYFSIPNI